MMLNLKNDFDKLFSNTYIGENQTVKKNNYYVLRFNFSGINTSTKEKLLEGFTNKILTGFIRFEEKYNIRY